MSEIAGKLMIGTKAKPIRFSYPSVFVPKAMQEGGKEKYSVSIIISKDDKEMIDKIKKTINAVLQDGKAKFGGKIPANPKLPLRDGDEERPDDEAYKNSFFLNANSDRQPGIVDDKVEDIINRDDFYAGCYGRVTVNFYAFNTSGNKGVAAGLGNIQKLEDGERLSGGASAQEDFGADLEDDSFSDPDVDAMMG